jgi:Putative zinc-finger
MALFEPHDWLTAKLVAFIARLTPRCKEVTRLLSQGMDRPLPLRTRVALRLHFTVCDYCRRYAKQLRFLRQVSRVLPQRGVGRSPVTLPEAAKARLRQALHAERPPDDATE